MLTNAHVEGDKIFQSGVLITRMYQLITLILTAAS